MMPKIHIWILAGLVGLAVVVGAIIYPHLPNPAPIHWNLSGQADGFGSPWIDAFLMPIVMAFLAGGLILVPRVSSFKENFAKFAKTLGRISVAMLLLMFVLHTVILMAALGWRVPIARVLPAACGLLIVVLGNWMGKIRRNDWIGIRTPWTLADEYVWNRTHRVGGWLMVVYGLAIALASLCGVLWAGAATVGGAIALLIWAMAYSSYVARHKPSAL